MPRKPAEIACVLAHSLISSTVQFTVAYVSNNDDKPTLSQLGPAIVPGSVICLMAYPNILLLPSYVATEFSILVIEALPVVCTCTVAQVQHQNAHPVDGHVPASPRHAVRVLVDNQNILQ